MIRITDSLINCTDNCQRCAPIDFLMPTSLALSAERAVERFIKLIQAISKTTKAMMQKICWYNSYQTFDN